MSELSEPAGRRTIPLSRQQIIDTAITLLDSDGEPALTFRALIDRLKTGNGAIYHHVANKSELLAAAADRVIDTALADVPTDLEPRTAVKAVTLRLFDAIGAHPWLGAQLGRGPAQPAMLQTFEAVGGKLKALPLPEGELFNSTFTLVGYVLGAAAQNASNAQSVPDDTDRHVALGNIASQWSHLDASRFPFLRDAAAQLPEHDDREQFIAGVDLILRGIPAAEECGFKSSRRDSKVVAK